MVVYKTKAERVKEAVQILKKFVEVGIRQTDPGYRQTKQYLDEWIKTGESRTYKYELMRYARKVELILPSREGIAPTCHLFPPDPEKWQLFLDAQKQNDDSSDDDATDKPTKETMD
jgi:hypothetical protein